MTTLRTLRRKLQKKKKHKPYRKCPKCGAEVWVKLVDSTSLPADGIHADEDPRLIAGCGACKVHWELFWFRKSGGGIGRRILSR